MPDHLTPDQRHKNMAAIHAKDTKPEMIVRKYLWSHGFRYRLNHHRLPGKPDIVLRKYRTCIFVNGCFWHKHEGCKYLGYDRYLTLAIDPRPVETEPLNVKQFNKGGESGRYDPQLVKIGVGIKK